LAVINGKKYWQKKAQWRDENELARLEMEITRALVFP
jgi:hypothetical protein